MLWNRNKCPTYSIMQNIRRLGLDKIELHFSYLSKQKVSFFMMWSMMMTHQNYILTIKTRISKKQGREISLGAAKKYTKESNKKKKKVGYMSHGSHLTRKNILFWLLSFFPENLLYERNNIELRIVNYIFYNSCKPIWEFRLEVFD